MADQRKGGIAWTEETWNPIRGCSKVSTGCAHCYAERVAARFGKAGEPYEGLTTGGRWTGEVRLVPEHLNDPLRWKRPRRVFVNSMSDLFHESVPDEWIDRVFAVMALAPQHTFQILTKRPERMREWLRDWGVHSNECHSDGSSLAVGYGGVAMPPPWYARPWPLPNVWLGVSVEDQATADERIPLLIDTPAAVRWISAEPLLGPVDISRYLRCAGDTDGDGNCGYYGHRTGCPTLRWVVVGGESGPHARPMHPDWARPLRDQCASAHVPFLFKQWGEWASTFRPSQIPTIAKRIEYLDHNGRRASEEFAMQGGDWVGIARIGKKAAGRELDGVVHDEYPSINQPEVVP